MKILRADESVKAFLASLTEETVFQDADGEMLGLFKPGEIGRDELNERARALFDPEEIERIKATERGGLPLKEIWCRIHERYKHMKRGE
jgi:hypothetical protein